MENNYVNIKEELINICRSSSIAIREYNNWLIGNILPKQKLGKPNCMRSAEKSADEPTAVLVFDLSV